VVVGRGRIARLSAAGILIDHNADVLSVFLGLARRAVRSSRVKVKV
jgi:hypothetical protein